MKKLILRCGWSPGDIVMLTAAVRDLHLCYPGRFLTDVRTGCPELWQHHAFLTPLPEKAADVEIIECDYPLIQRSNEAPYHCLHGFIEFLNERLGLQIKPTAFHGHIPISEEEKSWFSQVEELTGEETPFWIVAAGGKFDVTIKWWETRRYQEVVDHFRGRIQFVQVGELRHYHPKLAGVIDLRGQTDLRQLVRLVYHAQGVLCGVTALMHLAAAVETKPGQPRRRACVVVAGGREPAHWEAYPHHQFIHTNGALACCAKGGCWRTRAVPLGDGDERDKPENLCVDVVGDLPRCMDLITAAEVAQRIEWYFRGGALAYLTPAQAGAAQRGQACHRSVQHDEEALNIHTARMQAERFLRNAPAYPGRFRGRGIVLCGGGPRLFPSVWVCLQLLRRLGCTLPVELWYLGEREMDAEMQALVRPLQVDCIDATVVRQRYPVRILKGWELKAYALVHSRFREVLLLDADNVPVVNPQFLFQTPQFKKTGAIFWPDYGRLEPTRAIWDLCGVPYRDEPEFESGQIVVDKKRCWPSLALALWYNEHSDFFYQHIHGDKETFHLAFRKTGQPYAMPETPIESLGQVVMCQHDFRGRRIFQHRNLDKWSLFWPPRPLADFRFEEECLEGLRSLRRQWTGRFQFMEAWRSPAEKQMVEFLVQGSLEYRRAGQDWQPLVFRADGTLREGASEGAATWDIRESRGQLWVGLFFAADEACYLSSMGGGAWRGHGLGPEQKPIELRSLSQRTVQPIRPGRASLHASRRLRIQAVMISCAARDEVRAETLRRLADSDWGDAPVWVQMDAGQSADKLSNIRHTAHQALVMSGHSDADFILFLEDDLAFNRFIRGNLNQWPPLRRGQVTLAGLYNPGIGWKEKNRDWNCLTAHPDTIYGSQAYLMSRPTVEYVLEHWDDLDLMPDLKLPRLAARLGQPLYYHWPSLVQHVGRQSAWGGVFHEASDYDPEWRADRGPVVVVRVPRGNAQFAL